MRVRRKKHGAERLAACNALLLPDGFISLPELFGNDMPVHLEIGCGKGDFIIGNAKKYTDINYIAIERVPDVLVIAAEKVMEEKLENVRLSVMNASQLCERLPGGSISRVYLNFSDPWPKKGYAKRRLTHRGFLQLYKQILTPDGSLFLKTDDLPLFEFSLTELQESGFEITDLTYDLHTSEYATDNIMTEYERNFSSMGKKINSLRAYLKS